MLIAAMAAPLFASGTSAQEESPSASVAQAAEVTFAIPAQALTDALILFSRQSGVQVSAEASVTQGVGSPGASGSMTPEEGLRQLLAGSGLHYRFASDTSVIISAQPEAGAAGEGALTLGTVEVESRLENLRSVTSYAPTEDYVSYYSVAATKTDTPLIETPYSVSTIGREEMDDHNVRTVAEALRYTPGVSVDTYGVDPRGYDSISIRGFYSATTGSFRDGLRMDGPSFAVYTTEPYGIERIDLMRGPSGALYGQAEAGGVIDRTTKRPRADMVQEVRAEAGDWNRFQGAFDVGGAANKDGTMLFRLTGLARQGETEFDYNDGTPQQDDRLFFAPALTLNVGDRTSLTVLADYLKDKRSTVFGTFASEQAGRTHVVPGEPGFDKFNQQQYAIGYDFGHAFDDIWSFRQKARYLNIDVDYQSVDAAGLDPDGVTLNRAVWAAPDELGQVAIDNQLQADFAWGSTLHTLLAGVDYSYSVDDFSYHFAVAPPLDIRNVVYTGAAVPPPYQVTNQTLAQTGIYLQDQVMLLDRLIVTAGGRYSWVELETEDRLAFTTETKKDSAFTGRVGLTYLFDNGIAPYASYTEGFLPTEGTDLSGETFDPQESVQYELGVKYEPPTVNALLTGSVFQLTKTNVLTRDPSNIAASIQTGEIRVRGVELETKASFFTGLDLTLAYTYLDAVVTESNDVDLGKVPVTVPDQTAAAWLSYVVQQGTFERLGLGAGIRYVGEAYNDLANTSRTDDYAVVDARLSYALDDQLLLELNANNLFDKEYVTTCAFGSCYFGPGRRITAGLTYRW